jgi:hypothetical protein
MTLDVYADLFESDLDTVADRLDRQHTTDVPGTVPRTTTWTDAEGTWTDAES